MNDFLLCFTSLVISLNQSYLERRIHIKKQLSQVDSDHTFSLKCIDFERSWVIFHIRFALGYFLPRVIDPYRSISVSANSLGMISQRHLLILCMIYKGLPLSSASMSAKMALETIIQVPMYQTYIKDKLYMVILVDWIYMH